VLYANRYSPELHTSTTIIPAVPELRLVVNAYADFFAINATLA
jgi:hypothetical protein